MIFDLAIVGNGIASQTFLWTLGQKFLADANKSQNFSVAHLFSPARAPACSLRSTASVSLNGIEEGVSELGNDLRAAYFLFENIYQQHGMEGVIPVKQTIVATNEHDRAKLLRRFKRLAPVKNSLLLKDWEGVELNSYLLNAPVMGQWLLDHSGIQTSEYRKFVRDLTVDAQGIYHLHLEDQKIIKAKKIFLGMGAHLKIFAHFFEGTDLHFEEARNEIKAGSFVQKKIDLGTESFLLTMDGHQLSYRSSEKNLTIGNSMTRGAFEAPDLATLKAIFDQFSQLTKLDLGHFDDCSLVTGLRHKGPRRKFIAGRVHPAHDIFQVNGLYKNGFTLSFLAAREIAKKMNFN